MSTKLYAYNSDSPNSSSPYEVDFKPGVYIFELWGGSGNRNSTGGYVKGEITFYNDIKLYLHVGSKYYSYAGLPAYGGGGPGQFSGGGSSDIRLKSGDFGDFEGLKSRIIVAAGAGSADSDKNHLIDYGGAGSGLQGYDSLYHYGLGANQTAGGQGKGLHGRFGFGAGDRNRTFINNIDGNGGGGGGYFGGGNSNKTGNYGGGGGSSFISGHKGCIAVLENFSENENEFSQAYDPSIHFSGYQFIKTVMIDGMNEMPDPTGGTEKGHIGDGFIRITSLHIFECHSIELIYGNVCFSSLIPFMFSKP
ncbi:WAG22 antigen precursor, putative [Trichomonas vaginalis G3]|uniref:receptor protein-tyrosine kinase n=1 Tax=Trichomonas vaginalis (strain ATCC PRA-98 / G3) TaxID=412133 RepID=A2F3C9_TRIV3|nr:glycine-rich protein family [Trichomonas vaginalis G3]EAY00576.1 WAG22 antigen precursor, putative [Trichomonas vaginalis G3]KAI5547889.1 glycine-rich protein family [Trichomonas vaginalis G3]|eukprot:XP_001313505.1 WAG22 antigen precursor [Trichomonas vaginalis G3]